MIGHGRKAIDAGLLSAFAIVLGIQVGDLAALSAIRMAAPDFGLPLKGDDIAGLIWDVRRLRVDQIRQVREKAEAMVPD
jgi:hypothetical protein